MKTLSANILLLAFDDDPEDLEYFEEILKEYEVEKYKLYYRKDEFYNNLNSEINLVLIDDGLGETNGLEVLKDIKAQNPDNYVMVVSGLENFDRLKEYLNGGADRFVKKNDPNYREEFIKGVRIGFTKAQERLKNARERAEWQAAKEKKLTEKATDLINLIDRETTK